MAMVLWQQAGDARAQAPSPPPTNPNPSRPPPQASSQRLAATTALLSREDLLQPQTDDFLLSFAPASPSPPSPPVPSLPRHSEDPPTLDSGSSACARLSGAAELLADRGCCDADACWPPAAAGLNLGLC